MVIVKMIKKMNGIVLVSFGGVEHIVMSVSWIIKISTWTFGIYYVIVTNGGIQVITLGVMLGVLIILFHGLAICRSIRKKRRQPKAEPK